MNQGDAIEKRLDELGSFLRSRPNLADQLLERIAVLPTNESMHSSVALPASKRRRVRSFVGVGLATAALSFVALAIWLSKPAITLAQVAAAVNAKVWIHGRSTKAEIWVSPEHKIFARNVGGHIRFVDGRKQVQYEFNPSERAPKMSQAGGPGGTLMKSPLGSEWDFEVHPFQIISPDGKRIGQGLFGNSGFERIISQERHQVTAGGRTWTEFRLHMSVGKKTWILRVDPRTRLPVSMRVESQDNVRSEFQFDYPSDGPHDVYAAGVPREASKIEMIDLMPAPGLAEVLAGMSASRRALGDFKLYVCQIGERRRTETAVAYRKGDRCRVDLCVDADDFFPAGQPPPGPDRDAWWARSLARFQATPRYFCDGTRVWVGHQSSYADPSTLVWEPDNRRGPDALFGQGDQLPYGLDVVSKVYRDLTPRPGSKLEFVPTPASGPPGCVLAKRSDRLATGDWVHIWYYLDPKYGYAVVRSELCELPSSANTKVPMEAPKCYVSQRTDFQRSPGGFWYPALIATESITTDSSTGEQKHEPEANTYYHFDFSTPVDDSLFRFNVMSPTEMPSVK